jgi:glyoxalase/bleomycin resistance protein/dioxygenase superfamily protein
MIEYGNTLSFHHVGVACRPNDVDRERAALDLLGYKPESEEFVDPRLGIRGLFLTAPTGNLPRLELCIPSHERSPIIHWLDRGIKMYHLAFETRLLASELERLRSGRAKIVFPPTPAVAFDLRRVAFLMLPNMLLIEVIESAGALG